MLRCAGDLGGAHDRRVGGQDHAGVADLVQLLEGVLLERHVFGHTFEHEVGPFYRLFHVLGGGHARHGGPDIFELSETALGQEGQVVAHADDGLLQRLGPTAVQPDRVSGPGEHHGAAVAHGASADDGDLLDVFQLFHPATAPPSTERMRPVM